MARAFVILNADAFSSKENKILGVSYLDRVRLSASRAGFEEGRDFSEGAVLLESGVLLSRDFWKKLALAEIGPEEIFISDVTPRIVFLRTSDSSLTERILLEKSSLKETVAEILPRFKKKDLAITADDWLPYDDRGMQRDPERWLLRSLVKDTEGFMSKHLERKISLSVSRCLAPFPVSPNHMTIVSLLIGLAGAFFFLSGHGHDAVIGSLLFWLHSVLDGCDGEIARLKFQESRFGGVLDFWSDNLVHSAIFFAIGVSSNLPLAAAFAVAGTLSSAGLVYWTAMRVKMETEPIFTSVVASPKTGPTATEKFLDFLARRDFIYLVLLLSIFGKIQWFLWMGAIGSPLYFLILIVLNSKEKNPS